MMKVVLVTGASGGIGKEFARQFAYRGYNLLLVARRKDLLENIAEEFKEEYHVEVECFACDLSKDPKAVYDYCLEKDLQVSVLINNAGFGDYGLFEDADIKKLQDMIDLNNKALVTLTYYILKDMKKNGFGHIINVGSVASFVPGPYMAVYYASKAFVMSFSLALREELKKENIRVSVLCPAPTKSDFWKVADGEDFRINELGFARTSTDAAVSGYRLFETNKPYIIDGMGYKILLGIARHMPLELAAKAVRIIQKKTKGQPK